MTDPQRLEQARYFLRDHIRLEIDFSQTDQAQAVAPPPIEKPYPPDAKRVSLPEQSEWDHVGAIDLADAIAGRQSHRRYRPEPLHLDELAFLLWSTQGIRKQLGHGTALRTVPSAGARHAFETYVCVLAVDTLNPGIYRYLPVENELVHVASPDHLKMRLVNATLGQSFVAGAAVTLAWTTIPYRMEWRYGLAAHKVIALDAGHVCQNLYLTCQAIGAGTCAIAAYDQNAMDQLLDVDGKDEFTIYLAPVGKI